MSNRYIKSEQLLERALQTIPLASQTFSKSITQYPRGISPFFISKGEGCRVWDVDGNEYIDFVNGLLSISLGYNDPDVNAAVKQQLENGVIFSLPHILEMEVSEMLVEMVPCAEMVRFGKNGTDATSAAIRLARAYTGKEHILLCGYHGWQDWYIGTTTRDLGVPQCVKELSHVFKYNDIDSLKSLFEKYKDKVAAVIMEPMALDWPEPGFLEAVKIVANDNGALLVFDEVITGSRFAKGGAQKLFGVTPDLASFGKGIGNGFPISAILGRRDVMEKMEDIFFSGTNGGETLSLAAAKVVLNKLSTTNVIEKLKSVGEYLLLGVNKLIKENQLQDIVSIKGHPAWTGLVFSDTSKYSNLEIKTLFLQECYKKGILTIGTHNISYAHSISDIEILLQVYADIFSMIQRAIYEENLTSLLEVEPLAPLFKVR